MFEIIDTAVTNVLTAMIYGVPVLVTLAFIHFVITHPVPREDEPRLSTLAGEPQAAAVSQKLTIQPVEKQADSVVDSPELIVAAVECAPVDWTAWKVADLRDAAIRRVFNIPGEQNRRKLRKQALIERYQSALTGDSVFSTQVMH